MSSIMTTTASTPMTASASTTTHDLTCDLFVFSPNRPLPLNGNTDSLTSSTSSSASSTASSSIFKSSSLLFARSAGSTAIPSTTSSNAPRTLSQCFALSPSPPHPSSNRLTSQSMVLNPPGPLLFRRMPGLSCSSSTTSNISNASVNTTATTATSCPSVFSASRYPIKTSSSVTNQPSSPRGSVASMTSSASPSFTFSSPSFSAYSPCLNLSTARANGSPIASQLRKNCAAGIAATLQSSSGNGNAGFTFNSTQTNSSGNCTANSFSAAIRSREFFRRANSMFEHAGTGKSMFNLPCKSSPAPGSTSSSPSADSSSSETGPTYPEQRSPLADSRHTRIHDTNNLVGAPQALSLPHYFSPHEPDSLPRISHSVLIQVLDGEFSHVFDHVLLVDCRFEYEFQGGHIRGALNFTDKDKLTKHLFCQSPTPSPCSSRRSVSESPPFISTLSNTSSQFTPASVMGDPKSRVLIILHCEYSVHRAPLMAKYIRQKDRARNAHRYPELTYPEIYILDGGYSNFFRCHRTRCYPENYVEMHAKEHVQACERGMHRLRQRQKLSRAVTFAFGQSGVGSTSTAPSHNNSGTPGRYLFDNSPLSKDTDFSPAFDTPSKPRSFFGQPNFLKSLAPTQSPTAAAAAAAAAAGLLFGTGSAAISATTTASFEFIESPLAVYRRKNSQQSSNRFFPSIDPPRPRSRAPQKLPKPVEELNSTPVKCFSDSSGLRSQSSAL